MEGRKEGWREREEKSIDLKLSSPLLDMFTPLMAVGSSKTDREDDLVECARALVDKGARPNAHNRYRSRLCKVY